MATTNDRLQDILIRHATGLERLKAGTADRAQVALDEAERELAALIREALEELGPRAVTPAAQRRQLRELEASLVAIVAQRKRVWREYRAAVKAELKEFMADEADFIRLATEGAIGLEEVVLAAPAIATLRAATFHKPFGSPNDKRLLSQWFASLEAADKARILAAVRAGWVDQLPVEDTVRLVRGTRAARFQDGATSMSRRQAEAVILTALTHFASAVSEEVWQANPDIVAGIKWLSVLDGRTTAICQARDGRVDPLPGRRLPSGHKRLLPKGVRPPAHVRCRSVTIPVLSPEGIVGTRPFVTDVRTPARRTSDFRAEARRTGRPVSDIRQAWAERHIGRVPAETTYEEWLRRQSVRFQNELLGPTRGELFRNGGLTLARFVDHTGHRYTLAELRARNAEAFADAGLN